MDPFFVAAAEESSDRLSGDFAEDVPEGDIDAADGVCDGASASEPEHVLVQFFADAFWFEGVLVFVEGFEDGEGCCDEGIVGENAAEAGDAFVGVDGDEGVNAIFGAKFIGPTAFWSCASEACASDLFDFHFDG